ncbi:hypothetical protein D3C76_890040 [compost metagenome]
MRGDDHVGEGQQAGEHVVLQRQVGTVGEEDVGFFFIDVQAEVAELAALQRLDQRRGVDQRAAAAVDQHRAALHLLQAVGVDQVAGGVVERAVQADDVRLAEQPVELDELAADGLDFAVRVGIVGQHTAAEAGHDAGEHHADLAGADHADALAVQVEAGQAVQREVAFAGAVVGAVQVAAERQDQADGVFGDGVGRVGRHPHHGQPERPGGGQVDVVVAGRAQGDQARAAGSELFQHRARQVVVDEGADHLEAHRQRRGVEAQLRLLEMQFEAVRPVAGEEAFAVVVLAAEQDDAHGDSVLSASRGAGWRGRRSGFPRPGPVRLWPCPGCPAPWGVPGRSA